MIDTKPTTDARAAAGSQILVEAKVVSTSSEAGAPFADRLGTAAKLLRDHVVVMPISYSKVVSRRADSNR